AFSSTHFSLASGSSFKNAPFGMFTSAIEADCTKGNCGPILGSTYSFNILNFAGLDTATDPFNSLGILFAVDITRVGCTGNCTGVVGAAVTDSPNPVPLPPALLLFATGFFGFLGFRSLRQRMRAA